MLGEMMAWIQTHQALTFWLASLSFAIFVGSIMLMPLFVALIPEDYFTDPKRHENRLRRHHPMVYFALRGLKNLLGWALVLIGLIMLVLPGQGLLTILVGLLLSDFPGKYALERRLASNPRILGAINWLRKREGHPPLQAPTSTPSDAHR